MDAIAAGQLRGSPALAKRLSAAVAELERLQVRQSIRPVTILVPDVRKGCLAMVDRLDEVLTAWRRAYLLRSRTNKKPGAWPGSLLRRV